MTFYFYDVETSGFNPRLQRIMQFAGQRVDLDLNPIGQPHNFYIKLTEDILPDPEAVLITGITPQQAQADGLCEADFAEVFVNEVATPETVFVGYNSLRFDDEFVRHLLYRNFHDPYEWHWQEQRSRWDLLDLVRMTRALRPEGINWPMGTRGQPSNRLELMTAANGLKHEQAHSALGDVYATIELAKLIRDKQPKLFHFLLGLRDKKRVAEFVDSNRQFLYTSGRYSGSFQKTTVVTALAEHPNRSGVLVYDLRYNPAPFAKMSAAELAAAWKRRSTDEEPRLPIKTLQFNRCPAVAPLSVLDADSISRLKLDMAKVDKHYHQVSVLKDWTRRLVEAAQLLEQKRSAELLTVERAVDEQLYDGFFKPADKIQMRAVRQTPAADLSAFGERFHDARLKALLPLYKARNFSGDLTDQERTQWEQYRHEHLLSGGEDSRLGRFLQRVNNLETKSDLPPNHRDLLSELRLYAESILPAE